MKHALACLFAFYILSRYPLIPLSLDNSRARESQYLLIDRRAHFIKNDCSERVSFSTNIFPFEMYLRVVREYIIMK